MAAVILFPAKCALKGHESVHAKGMIVSVTEWFKSEGYFFRLFLDMMEQQNTFITTAPLLTFLQLRSSKFSNLQRNLSIV